MKKYYKKKKKNKNIDLKYKIILGMTIVVVGIALLSYSYKNDSLYVTKIINNIFYYPFSNMTNRDDIIGRNINLELIDEIAELKKLTGIKNVLTDYEIINSVVISRNVAYWQDELIINRGSKNGIEKGMAVVVSEGLVGYISEVYDNSARVTLITNSSHNKTSVKVNNLYLILEYDEDELIINQLDNKNTVRVGDIVLTSGLTDKFPAGLTIGKISKIEDNNYESGKKLYISLNYDINSLRYVSVLKRNA